MVQPRRAPVPPSGAAPDELPEELPEDDPDDEPEDEPEALPDEEDVDPELEDVPDPDDDDEEPDDDPEGDPEDEPDEEPEDEPDDEPEPDAPAPPPSPSFPKLPVLFAHAPNVKAAARTGTPSNHRPTMRASVCVRSPLSTKRAPPKAVEIHALGPAGEPISRPHGTGGCSASAPAETPPCNGVTVGVSVTSVRPSWEATGAAQARCARSTSRIGLSERHPHEVARASPRSAGESALPPLSTASVCQRQGLAASPRSGRTVAGRSHPFGKGE
jgi:hypothetical protein